MDVVKKFLTLSNPNPILGYLSPLSYTSLEVHVADINTTT